ncbi:glycoside hydrolase superfamily [Protomyces lactucae-debilis]|uniref:Glycoside hydrolase superfamily n=1 Tax=Protomyces lactucae-debilis TaxID=2754530 RepID=A0A1Y2FVE6_PROLT|nr:glycoside hydrolase superfamily [Protomyces lactucae-debilis]ORY87993.1 glycoside hydrolase superfamily [Protomyces lactucae-debilis]
MNETDAEHNAASFRYLEQLRNSVYGPFFADQYDRTLLLRGINVSGASKLPSGPDFPRCIDPLDEAFWKPVSFVGRPFPVEEARAHWQRLKSWGLSLIRFVVTWEAIEPDEPGVYDEEYLKYVASILKEASDIGLLIVIDMHQDCWSRFTGGSGAPLWTLHMAGIDATLHKLHATGAALLQGPKHESYAEPGTLWATNYTKFAINHMFTLFFGGEVFAPNCQYKGEAVGLVLRRHFIDAAARLASTLAGIHGILGFDVLNEPHAGFIGLASLDNFNEDVHLHLGNAPSGIQSMLLASGVPQEVPHFTKSWPVPTKKTSIKMLNADGIRLWRDDMEDVWRQHSVWNIIDGQTRYDPRHFTRYPKTHARAGEEVKFLQDFYRPFLMSFDQAIKAAMPHAYTFVEPIPNIRNMGLLDQAPSQTCFAPHWYDLQALFEKKWSRYMTMNVQQLAQGSRNLWTHTYFGKRQAADNYTKQYAWLFQDAPRAIPRLIGETGIPFDMNKQYQRGKVVYQDQADMLDVMCTAMERNLLSYTLWNYTPENKSHRGGGDLWNGECFSVYCAADHVGTSIYAGTRAREGWIRPHAFKIAGQPLLSEYSADDGIYRLRYKGAGSLHTLGRTTEVFVPKYLRIEAIHVSLRRRCTITTSLDMQTITICHEEQELIEVEIPLLLRS